MAEGKYRGYSKFKTIDEYNLPNLEPGWHVLDSFIVETIYTNNSTEYTKMGMSFTKTTALPQKVVRFLVGYTELGKALYDGQK